MQQQVDDVQSYVSDVLHQIAHGVPRFLAALLFLIIGWIIAKVIASIVRRALERAQLNRHLHAGRGGNIIQRAVPNPTGLIAGVTFWLLFLFVISVAITALGIPALADIVHGIYAYIPNVIAALAIFLAAGAIATAVAGLITNTMGDTATGKLMATTAPIIIMGLALFMILNQLKIAPEIVTITYAGIVGSLTLAFGLGGREVAGNILMGLYETGKRNQDRAATDVQKGAQRAQQKARSARNRLA